MKLRFGIHALAMGLAALITAGMLAGLDGLADQQQRHAFTQWACSVLPAKG